jgi:hypothetical protein
MSLQYVFYVLDTCLSGVMADWAKELTSEGRRKWWKPFHGQQRQTVMVYDIVLGGELNFYLV